MNSIILEAEIGNSYFLSYLEQTHSGLAGKFCIPDKYQKFLV